MYLFQQNERYMTIPIVRVTTAQLVTTQLSHSTLLRRMQLKHTAADVIVHNRQQTRANMHVYIMNTS